MLSTFKYKIYTINATRIIGGIRGKIEEIIRLIAWKDIFSSCATLLRIFAKGGVTGFLYSYIDLTKALNTVCAKTLTRSPGQYVSHEQGP